MPNHVAGDDAAVDRSERDDIGEDDEDEVAANNVFERDDYFCGFEEPDNQGSTTVAWNVFGRRDSCGCRLSA